MTRQCRPSKSRESECPTCHKAECVVYTHMMIFMKEIHKVLYQFGELYQFGGTLVWHCYSIEQLQGHSRQPKCYPSGTTRLFRGQPFALQHSNINVYPAERVSDLLNCCSTNHDVTAFHNKHGSDVWSASAHQPQTVMETLHTMT